ncbi:uncharacterized protein [Aegilops tauschii subsp. strangulata]|uniref:uncharacterized protein n=1 Tax=Aegilops tauschii subsp. strangulata TaxID=200361 RepID=UPI001E1CADF0|nr:uncharacterized protein LOC109783472 [Aegilops tauschii subsp. strangulata]
MAIYDTLFSQLDVTLSQLLVIDRDFRDPSFGLQLHETEFCLRLTVKILFVKYGDPYSGISEASLCLLSHQQAVIQSLVHQRPSTRTMLTAKKAPSPPLTAETALVLIKVSQCIGLRFCVSFPSSCHSGEERSEASIQTQEEEETRSNTYFYCPSSPIILCGSSHLITNLNE